MYTDAGFVDSPCAHYHKVLPSHSVIFTFVTVHYLDCSFDHKHTESFLLLLTVSRAVYEPFVVTTSCLEVASKKSVKTLVKQLGGHLVVDWRKECNCVVMGNLSVTIKVTPKLLYININARILTQE